MVTFRMNACITFAELMLNNCFKEGPLLDCYMDLNFLVLKYCSEFSSTLKTREIDK